MVVAITAARQSSALKVHPIWLAQLQQAHLARACRETHLSDERDQQCPDRVIELLSEADAGEAVCDTRVSILMRSARRYDDPEAPIGNGLSVIGGRQMVDSAEMGKDARMQIWKAFLEKLSADSLTASELDSLVNRRVSGRQIKNAIRTAAALAKGRQELMGYTHLMESLDAIEEFQREMTSRAGNLYS